MHNKRIGRDDLLKIEVSNNYLPSTGTTSNTFPSGLVLLHLHLGDSTLDAMSHAAVDVKADASLAALAVNALLVVVVAAAVLQSLAEVVNTLHAERKTAVSATTMTDEAAALLDETAK
jgi:predicted cation transporter